MPQNSKYVGDNAHILGQNRWLAYNKMYSKLHNTVLKFLPEKSSPLIGGSGKGAVQTNIGWSCLPSYAARTAGAISSYRQLRLRGLALGSSWPKGTK